MSRYTIEERSLSMLFSRLKGHISVLKGDILNTLMSVELFLAEHYPGIYRFLVVMTRSPLRDEPELAQLIKEHIQPEYGEGTCDLVWLRLHSRFKSLYRFGWLGFLRANIPNATEYESYRMIAGAIRDEDFKREILHHLEWQQGWMMQLAFADCVRIEEGVW